MRLSESRAAAAATVERAPHPSAADTLRAEIRQQLRVETDAELRRLADVERDRARAEGLAAARSVAAGEMEEARAELRVEIDLALEALEGAHAAALRKLEASVGEVAFAAVCRFVSSQGASRDFVRALVEQACSGLRGETLATARLHPRDIALLDDLLSDGAMRIQSLGLRLRVDESLPLGGCIVETASGELDGGLESQLRQLRAVLCGDGSRVAAK
jgi:flagellar assembly protein FliH